MNLFTTQTSDEFFGGHASAVVRGLLRRAAGCVPDERTSLLWTAHALAPDCLPVYYALYKHHTVRRELALAARAAWRGLSEAAVQAGLPPDLRRLQSPLAVDFTRDGPARFWLFTLKALAFIHLRGGQRETARALLATLQACDPQARNGDEVIEALLAGTQAPPRR